MDLSRIAQEIVDITMEEINNRNINIMNLEGIIIASGERKRINIFHKGAYLAILHGQNVEIYKSDIGQYPGAKEGVNIPISIRGKIVGVVGVSGNPDEVRMIGRLVKRLVEYSIEEKIISDELKTAIDVKNQFIRNIIFGKTEEVEEEILCLANSLKLDIKIERKAVIISIHEVEEKSAIDIVKSLRGIENIIQNSRIIHNQVFGGIINQRYVMFADEFKGKNYTAEIMRLFDENSLTDEMNIRVAVGSSVKGWKRYKQSYFEASKILEFSEERMTSVLDMEIQADYLMNLLKIREMEVIFEPIINRISEDGIIPEWFIKTLNSLFENDLNSARAADGLYTHRNTITYRIKKIQSLTGLSLYNFNHAILLKLLLIYYKKIERFKGETK